MRAQRIVGILGVIGMLAVAVGVAAAQPGGSGVELTVLSSRADTVTGPEALLRIDVPAGVALDNVRVTVNGADATVAFRADAERHRLVGLIEGLTPGSNRVSVTAAGAGAGATAQDQKATPDHAPLNSGPQEEPVDLETQG
ncbi:MAG: hypothetical protein F4Y45_15405, partial [Acidobacteria bacterium]|nr:hypothetical protein [Acidobacteriota bacterium]